MLVCAESDSAEKAIEMMALCKPDLAIVDISLKDIDGLHLTRILRREYPSLRILVLSMHDEHLYAGKALKAGANGYLMKEETTVKLLEVIRTIMNGKNWINESVKDEVLSQLSASRNSSEVSPIESLSSRERQVFRMIGLGYNCTKIASELKVKKKTIETHRTRIRSKIGIYSAPRLILAASEWVRKEGNDAPHLS